MRSWRAQGMTQVLRLVYLQHFGGAGGAWNLTPDLLNKVDTDLGTARRAGVKVILRLAYNLPPARVWPPPAPYEDAPVERTLHHIHQLGPILRHNADVIETVQEGFIGLWGEGYYSDYFSNPADPTVVTATNWTDRGRVLRARRAVRRGQPSSHGVGAGSPTSCVGPNLDAHEVCSCQPDRTSHGFPVDRPKPLIQRPLHLEPVHQLTHGGHPGRLRQRCVRRADATRGRAHFPPRSLSTGRVPSHELDRTPGQL